MIWFPKRLILIAGLMALLAACAEERNMVLPAAPANLLDKNSAVRIESSAVVIGKHGHVVAGAGEGAAMGVLLGGGTALSGGLSAWPVGLLVGIALAPVFMVGGGVIGGASAHPADETQAAVAAIEQVYSDEQILLGVPENLREKLRQRGFMMAEDCNVETADSMDCATDDPNRIAVTVKYAFATEGDYSPLLSYAIDVQVLEHSAEQGSPANKYRWIYLSPELDFFSVTASNAERLIHSLDVAHRQLATQIVRDLIASPSEVRVHGVYSAFSDPPRFLPDAVARGLPRRVPMDEDLANPRTARFSN